MGETGKWNFSSTQFSFLCRAIESTRNFEEPTNLAVYVRDYQKERSIAKSTMVNYLHLFEMVDYKRAYKRSSVPVVIENEWTKMIKDVRMEYQKASLEKKQSKKELFHRVPGMEGVAAVINRIEELCEDFVAKNLSFEELKVFTFLSLYNNMNGRVGPLMELTWNDVKRINKHGKITSDHHKTGHYYDQELKIHEEQFPWLHRLKEEFRKKHGYSAKLVFATSVDTKDHSMSATVKIELTKHFSDDVLEKDFNGTSIR